MDCNFRPSPCGRLAIRRSGHSQIPACKWQQKRCRRGAGGTFRELLWLDFWPVLTSCLITASCAFSGFSRGCSLHHSLILLFFSSFLCLACQKQVSWRNLPKIIMSIPWGWQPCLLCAIYHFSCYVPFSSNLCPGGQEGQRHPGWYQE